LRRQCHGGATPCPCRVVYLGMTLTMCEGQNNRADDSCVSISWNWNCTFFYHWL